MSWCDQIIKSCPKTENMENEWFRQIGVPVFAYNADGQLELVSPKFSDDSDRKHESDVLPKFADNSNRRAELVVSPKFSNIAAKQAESDTLTKFPGNSNKQVESDTLTKFPGNSNKQVESDTLPKFPDNSNKQVESDTLPKFPDNSNKQVESDTLPKFPGNSNKQVESDTLPKFPGNSNKQIESVISPKFPNGLTGINNVPLCSVSNKSIKSAGGDFAPTSWNQVIGQSGMKESLQIAIKAAQNTNSRLDHCLLSGGKGLGKTAFSKVIAAEMKAAYHVYLGNDINTLAKLNKVLLQLKDGDILHVEEAHTFPLPCQNVMLHVLDEHVITPVCDEMPILIHDFTLILSTTNKEYLLPPLRSRMQMDLCFVPYSVEELRKIIEAYCHNLGWKIDPKIIHGIAKRGRGTPRCALNLLRSVKRVCLANHIVKMEEAHFREACRINGIYSLGLNKEEHAYLRFLLDNGATQISVLASKFGDYTIKNLSQTIEPILFQFGLITKDAKSRRTITGKGVEYFRSQSVGNPSLSCPTLSQNNNN